jgi:hypothetical protein
MDMDMDPIRHGMTTNTDTAVQHTARLFRLSFSPQDRLISSRFRSLRNVMFDDSPLWWWGMPLGKQALDKITLFALNYRCGQKRALLHI